MLSVCYHFVFVGICKKDALALIDCGRPVPFHFICNTKYQQSLVEGAREPVSEHRVMLQTLCDRRQTGHPTEFEGVVQSSRGGQRRSTSYATQNINKVS